MITERERVSRDELYQNCEKYTLEFSIVKYFEGPHYPGERFSKIGKILCRR